MPDDIDESEQEEVKLPKIIKSHRQARFRRRLQRKSSQRF